MRRSAAAERVTKTVDAKNKVEALFKAAGTDDTKTLTKLLKDGVNPNSRVEGFTPLMAACAKGNTSCVKILLGYGADCSMRCVNGTKTALFIATQIGNVECVELLLDAGANPNERYVEEGNTTPLMHACHLGYLNCVRVLIHAGADVNARNIDGVTPVRIAGSRGDQECLYLLQQAGAKY